MTTRRNSKTISYDSEESIRWILIEILIYSLFLFTTIEVATTTRDIRMFYFNQAIERIFLKRASNDENDLEIEFGDISTTGDFWAFMETTFLHGIHSSLIADESGGNSSRKILNENLLLSPARLRQIRVRNDTCHIHQIFRNHFKTCYGRYSSSIEEREEVFFDSPYQSMSELNAYPLWGRISNYYSGGYEKLLTFDKDANEKIVQDLKESHWIDRGTRIVVVEFALYNANIEIFSNIKFLVETPPTGGAFSSRNLQTFKAHTLWTTDDKFTIFWAIVFYLFIIYYTVIEIRDVRRMGARKYFASLWCYVDLTTLLIGYFTLVFIIWNHFKVEMIMKKFSKNSGKYLSLDILSFWRLIYVDMLGICAFLVAIKIFKYISFNKTMLQFSTTLRRCSKDLLGFGLMFAIVFIAYAELGLLLFSTQHPDFRNFPESILTMMRMVLGDFEYTAIEDANRILGPIYFLTYILLVFFILLNMFLAIINDTYSDVKAEIVQGENHLEIYLKKCFRKFCNFLCCRKTTQTEDDDTHIRKTQGDQPREKEDNKDQKGYPKAINRYFEVVPEGVDRTDGLAKRVAVLENTTKILITNLDDILKRIDAKIKSK